MSEKTYTDGTVVNGPGQLPTRSPRQQDAEVLLRLLNDVESMLGGTNGLTIQLRAALAAAPAQERIDALELEVRQLTEQIAGLRHALTPQADSQPAQAQAGAAPRYRLLVRGRDTIQADDEFLREDDATWLKDPSGIFVGCMYEGTIFLPARRAIDEARGIKGGQHDL